jgi:hypothetical protein
MPVPYNLCAVVYDDGGCEGWKLDIPEGDMMFKWWNPAKVWYRNDIEQVSVRAGCTFTGYDDSSLNGQNMVVRAVNTDRKEIGMCIPGSLLLSKMHSPVG